VVRCDTLIGWNGVAREGRFAPLIVSLENPGSRLDVEVQVEMAWGAGARSAPYRRVFTRKALIPPGAARRIPFVVPVRRDVRSLRVSVLSRGVEIAGEDVDLRSAGGPGMLVAAVSSELSLDSLSGLSRPGANVRVVYPRVDDLPESWAAWDGISLLVVHDTSFQELRPAQVSAIERWVACGGVLVFTGGAGALQYSSAGFARLLPVQVSGIRETTELRGLGALLGERAPPRGRTVLAESTVIAGTALASQEGIPLVVQRRLGAGSVWFAAFDPSAAPLDSWPGWLSFWRRVCEGDRPAALDTAFLDPVDDPWIAALLDFPPVPFPSIIAALLFIAAYFLLLFFLLTGRLSRTLGARLRAILLFAVSGSAVLAGWLLFNRVMLPPAPRILEAGRVEAISGDGLGIVTERLGLFATRAVSISLAIESPDVAVDEISANGSAPRGDSAGPAPLMVDLDRGVLLKDVALGRFASRMFALRAVLPFAISARLTASDSAIRIGVVNATGRALRGAFLVRGGRGYPLGDLAAGSSTDRDVSSSEGIDLRGRDAAARLCGEPRKAAFWSRAGLETGSDVLVGWLDDPLVAMETRGAQRPADRPPLLLVTVRLR
jgi:hypothetical protein